MTNDAPNAFIQAHVPEGKERIIMKITGVLVDMLVEIAPETYGPYVVFENGKKVLYVRILRALYGMLISALLWYNKLREDLEAIGFIFNPYDPCVANRMIRGHQHTVLFHVDDIKSSHVDSKVNDEFLAHLNKLYGKFGEMKASRGKVHRYLGMILDFSEDGKVSIDMREYVETMLDEFRETEDLSTVAATPAAGNLFEAGTGELLDRKRREIFHRFVAKGLFLCKRARPDIQMTISVLATRVREPTITDWKKLVRLMRYLNGTSEEVLTLSADNLHTIKWYVDASFAVHPDFRSHTGAVMQMESKGQGAILSSSSKQKLNTRSSCLIV